MKKDILTTKNHSVLKDQKDITSKTIRHERHKQKTAHADDKRRNRNKQKTHLWKGEAGRELQLNKENFPELK